MTDRGTDMTDIRSRVDPVHVGAGEGETLWLNGDVYAVKLDRERSGGSLTVLEADVPPGGGPPLHNHLHEDEAFYVLAGELEIRAGGRTYTAGVGDFVFVPSLVRGRSSKIPPEAIRSFPRSLPVPYICGLAAGPLP